ncbi:MAG: hypothetical protein ABIH71_05505 [Candidatus Omnitrophota bacterium]|nr:hypothetical protein [Candidatus Omnitrophota bacterium]
MDNQRKLIRLEVKDFLEIKLVDEVAKTIKAAADNFTLMGICFTSQQEWKKGQVLLIDYFMPSELDSVKLKISVVWSELIDSEKGYFCGGEIGEIEDTKQDKFASYYFQRLKERFF